MTTSFADYAAQQDARNTIQLNVVKYAHMLCDALRDVLDELRVAAPGYALHRSVTAVSITTGTTR